MTLHLLPITEPHDMPRVLCEVVSTDGDVYSLFTDCGDLWLHHCADGNQLVPANTIPITREVLRALAAAADAPVVVAFRGR